MAPLYPLYCRRSDGKTEITIRKRRELNQPTEDQLDQKPDKDGVSDFYREVAIDEPKHLDWRRKLGGMLARYYSDPKEKSYNDSGHILAVFPEGYRLFEHVKRTEKDGKLEVKSKTHAAGGNDRQDAYLYGHPEGRRKRFRSPADYFPHLLWLCDDESGDPDNCSCKLCCPEDVESLFPNTTVAPTPASAAPQIEKPVNRESEQRNPTNQQTSVQTTVTKSNPDPPQSSIPPQMPAVVQTPSNSQVRPKVPSPLPRPRTQEQYIDSQYTGYLYRTGELVWFHRGQRWGLGVVLQRWETPQGSKQYSVQPLSHPFHHPEPVAKESTTEMRPWLAWSVPQYTSSMLNSLADPARYDKVDWEGLLNGRYGTSDVEVDGSILAAKAIDASYTPISKNSSREVEPGVTESRYDGLFLGGEKIWLGDPIRLQFGSGSDVMVLQAVIERQQPSGMSIYLVGDIYTLTSMPHSDPNQTLAAATSNPCLPSRLKSDLAYRNARSIPIQKRASFWQLASTNVRIEPDNVKGRWYESSRLLPILNPDNFAAMARQGEFQEASLWMNSRGDCINNNRNPALPRLPRENVRKSTRREALGRAVPPNTEIINSEEPPNIDPSLDAEDGISGGNGNGNNGNGGDEMNIDPRFETADNIDLTDYVNLR